MIDKKIYIGGKRIIYDISKHENQSSNLLKINSKYFVHSCARNSISEIISHYNKQQKLNFYQPQFICDSVINVFQNNCPTNVIEYTSFNELKKKLIRKKNVLKIVLIVDYFGLTNIKQTLKSIKDKNVIIIADLCHCFPTIKYLKTIIEISDFTLISLRKFLPVPNGSITFSNNINSNHIFTKSQYKKINLLFFLLNNKVIDNLSHFLKFKRLLNKCLEKSIYKSKPSLFSINAFNKLNLDQLNKIRVKNFLIYLQNLSPANLDKYTNKIFIGNPLYFPLRCMDPEKLQRFLIKRNIFCPIFWKNNKKSLWIIALPIDDRYNSIEINYVINTIEEYYSLNPENL